MITTYSESVQEFLDLLGMEPEFSSEPLHLLEAGNSRYATDLKVSFKNSFSSELLSYKEIALLGVALATNDKNQTLLQYFVQEAKEQETSDEEIAEAVGCASLLSANNVFYRFRHFMQKEKYNKQPARIKMNIMRKPVTGKEFFELMSLAVSAVNGCEMCVKAHEDSLLKLESTEDRIFEAVRFSAVYASLSKII